jgi:flagella basal body P-ring formation protein FlgA
MRPSSFVRPKPARARRRSTLAAALGSAALSAGAWGAQWQSPESIRAAAEQYVRLALAGRSGISVEARGVDQRVKLPACSQPLEAHAERPLRNGQGSVAVACPGAPAWRLFVPVRASHTVAVVVATTSLTRGQRLSPEQVDLQPMPSTALPLEYLTRLDDAVGLTLKRSVPAGTVLVSAALDRPRLVQRGRVVTLIAGKRGIMVKSDGVALHDAGLNDRVRVKTPAGRVVEGTVEAPNQVRVGT